ncbi:SAP domain-containing protein [Cellulomonas sp. NS3]|uniref:SAP domain-containing protein n=1 Tax=Cellulomonas sp. NS3 TaxID=2973977 RepID=UPI0021639E82|nr:SAP domain-containing protein [Cellulomonas sp. NS3]
MSARPDLTPALSGGELLRWYWLREELAVLARTLGVRTSGSKQELTERLAAALDGRPAPARSAERAARRPAPSPLVRPLTDATELPLGQRCSQELRTYLAGRIGPGFRFDGHLRELVGSRAGLTLGDVVAHWHATRDCAPREIGAQFELNRFLRAWHAAHPGRSHTEALDAWRAHRALPVDAREAGSGQEDVREPAPGG